jgi:hypothetical protein
MHLRGDYSAEAARLSEMLPGLRALPRPALESLLEAERRWTEHSVHDYAPDIVSFAKAVEITLKQCYFDGFRKELIGDSLRLDEVREALYDKRVENAHRFLKFLDGGSHLELGSMVFILRLLSGKTSRRLGVLRQFRSYIAACNPKLASELSTILDRIDGIAKVRNPAAHAETFTRETADRVRESCLAILGVIAIPEEGQ